MTRVKMVSAMVLAGTIVAWSGGASAQSHATTGCVDCEVTFDVAVIPDGLQLRAAGGGGVVIEKRVDRRGLRVSLSSAGDTLDIVGALDGTVTIGRRGKVIAVRPDSVLPDYAASVKALTAGSAAVEGLERMVSTLRHNNRPEAMSVVATFALLRSLHGDDTGNTLLAQYTAKRPGPGVVPIAAQTRAGDTVSDCWEEYERALFRNHDRYNRCLRDYWWNQPVQYACGLEFAMVAELSLFRVISCSGGFPLP